MSPKPPNELFEQNINLAYSYLQKHTIFLRGYDPEDLQQEALLALWRACLTYQPARGKFSTYATTCIANRFKDLIKIQSRKVDEVLTDPDDLGKYY